MNSLNHDIRQSSGEPKRQIWKQLILLKFGRMIIRILFKVWVQLFNDGGYNGLI